METRKITIANSRTQSKKVIMTAATTLGELKQDLDAAQIDYTDMDFIEALTKTQLHGDDSVLPHDVPYNHTTTNDLVFLLTTPNRKIKSGNRGEVYQYIQNHARSAELMKAIKDHFGCEYFAVTTSDLEDFIEDWENKDVDVERCSTTTPEVRLAALECKVNNIHEAIMEIIDVLNEDYFTESIYSALTKKTERKPEDNTVYSAGMSADDIDTLISGAMSSID